MTSSSSSRDCVAKARAYRHRLAACPQKNDATLRTRGAQTFAEDLLPQGFVGATLVETTVHGHLRARRSVIGTAQNLYERLYAERMHHLADPVLSEILRSNETFAWSDLPARRGRLTNRECRVLRDAEKFGFSEGYVVPERDMRSGGMTALVFYGRRVIDPEAEDRSGLERLARAMFADLLDGSRSGDAPASIPRTLRSRQIECLQWAALGKTSTEIGMILGLSRKTVDEHVENACRIFGVNGRIQAVARAIDAGLIELR